MWRRIVALSLVGCALGACSESKDTSPVFPAQEGAVQPPGNGVRVAEEVACEALTSAIDARRSALSCGAAERAACPELIRPAGGKDCYEYDQGSLDRCVSHYGQLTSCAELTARPCIITAYATASCEGAGGAGGAGGTSGSGGAAGSAGTGGVGGAGGSGGVGGAGGSAGAAGSGGVAGSAGAAGSGGVAGSAGAAGSGS